MLIGANIAPILIVTGAITAVPVLQFIFPRPVLRLLSGVTLDDDAGLFFARHWGLVTLSIGALLIYAATNAAARPAIVLAILVEKLGYAGLVFANWNRFPKMRGSGLFDAACCLVYAAYLLGA